MDVSLQPDLAAVLADPYWAYVLSEQDAEMATPVFGGQTPEWSDQLGGDNLQLFLKDEIAEVVCAYTLPGEEFDLDELDERARPCPANGACAGVFAMRDGRFVSLRASSGVEWDGTTDCCLRAYVRDWAELEWAASREEALALGLTESDRRLLGLASESASGLASGSAATGWPATR